MNFVLYFSIISPKLAINLVLKGNDNHEEKLYLAGYSLHGYAHNNLHHLVQIILLKSILIHFS